MLENPAIAGELLNPQERAALEFAHDLYGGQVKLAAGEVAMSIGLKGPAGSEFVGAVEDKVTDMDFEQRRRVALQLKDLARVLSGDIVLEVQSPLPSPSELTDIVYENNVQPSNNGHASGIDTARPPESRNQVSPVTRQQRSWLLKAMGEEEVAMVEALSDNERLSFAHTLGEHYQRIKIPRLSEQDKAERAEQLKTFMGGTPYKTMAAQAGVQAQSIKFRFTNMARRISDTFTAQEIRYMIAGVKSNKVIQLTSSTAEDTGRPPTLERIQRNWLGHLLQDQELVEAIEEFTPEQRGHLAERLGANLRPWLVRRETPVKAQRRVVAMDLLITSGDVEHMVGSLGRPAKDIKQELHSTAGILHRRVGTKALAKLVHDVAKSESEQVNV